MTKRDIAIEELCKNLGSKYRVETIFYEKSIVRNFDNGFEVVIQNVHTISKKKKPTIELWYRKDVILFKIEIPSQDDIETEVERLLGFSYGLLYGGINTTKKLYRWSVYNDRSKAEMCLKDLVEE